MGAAEPRINRANLEVPSRQCRDRAAPDRAAATVLQARRGIVGISKPQAPQGKGGGQLLHACYRWRRRLQRCRFSHNFLTHCSLHRRLGSARIRPTKCLVAVEVPAGAARRRLPDSPPSVSGCWGSMAAVPEASTSLRALVWRAVGERAQCAGGSRLACAQHPSPSRHGDRPAWARSIARRTRSAPSRCGVAAAAGTVDRAAPASALAGGTATGRRTHIAGLAAVAAAMARATAVRPSGPGLRNAPAVRCG